MEDARGKLNVPGVLLGAISAPTVHWRRIAWFAIPLIALEWATPLLQGRLGSESASAALGSLALGFASWVAWLLIAVACHRILILGESSMAGRGLVWWTPRETRFLGWTVALSLTAAMLVAPVILLTLYYASQDLPQNLPLAYLLALPGTYVFCRLALVLPATATDSRPDFEWAWQASKGNGIRLLIVIVLLPGLLRLLLAGMPEIQSLAYEFAASLVKVYVLVVEIAALSISYRELSRLHPVPDPLQEATE